MVGLKPTRLWHHLCREHFWWLIRERIYARCPVKKQFKKYHQIPDPCPDIVCPPLEHFNKFDMLKIVGIVLASAGGLSYSFGRFDPTKYEPCALYDCSIDQKEKVIKKKVPCDQREPEEIPPCICEEPAEPPKKIKKKGK